MKKLFTTFSFLFLVNMLFAQASFGLKVMSPTVSSEETYKEFFNRDAGTLYGLTYLSTRTTASVGLSFHSSFQPGWLTIDLLYRKRSTLYNLEKIPVDPRSQNLVTDEFKELTIPVVAGINRNNFKIGLGPVFNFKLASKYGIQDVDGFTINPRNLNTGFQFMFGYVIKDRFHVNLIREVGFNQVGEDYKSMGKFINMKTRPKNISVSVGLYL